MSKSLDDIDPAIKSIILPFKNEILNSLEDNISPNFEELSLVTKIVETVGPLIHDKDYHFFCDPDLGPVISFLVIIFSVPREQQAIQWYCDKFSPILASCQDCLRAFYTYKNKIIQRYIVNKGIAYSNIDGFDLMICRWRADTLLQRLGSIKSEDLSNTQKIAFIECFWYPRVLKHSQNLKILFNNAFDILLEKKSPLLAYLPDSALGALTSGSVFMLMEGTPSQISWGLGLLDWLYEQNYKITIENLPLGFLQEINTHYIYLISKQFSKDQQYNANASNSMAIAWIRLTALFSLMDKEVLEAHFLVPKFTQSLKNAGTLEVPSIIHLWYNWFSVPDPARPLDVMLKVMSLFLDKFGNEFWSHLKPFNFHSLLDLIFAQGTFANTLLRKQDFPILRDGKETWLSLNGSVSDLITWCIPFYNSLSSGKKMQMVKKISTGFLMTICECNQMLQTLPKLLLMSYSLQLLNNVLEIDDKKRSSLYVNSDLQNELLTVADCRKVLNHPKISQLLCDTVQKPAEVFPGMQVDALSLSAMKVLSNCIEYDILNLCGTTFQLYTGGSINRHHILDLDMKRFFLNPLVNDLNLLSLGSNGPKHVLCIMSALTNANGLMVLNVKGLEADNQNKITSAYIGVIRQLISRFPELPSQKLIEILANRKAAHGLWSCLFSSDNDLYQETTNILYEVFNVEGRLEGLHELFKNSLSTSLHCISIVLRQLTKTKFFEPCPRAVRVMMDVLALFNEPVTGIFSDFKKLKDSESNVELFNFWRSSWKFLDMIYLETIRWTSKYSNVVLENFTRDVLEVSNMLMGSYREFSDVLVQGSISEDDLFKFPMSPFKNMLYWLRLNDEQLLASCVKLIVSASDLAKEKQFRFDELLVLDMVKYASKARKYPNKLSASQSQELLERARFFNKALTSEVVKESEKYHLEKELLKKGVKPTASSAESKTINSTVYQQSNKPSMTAGQRADSMLKKANIGSSMLSRPKGQSTLSSYGFFKPGGTPTVNAPVAKPLSRFELERKKLIEKRVIHPAQAQVFNTRPTLQPKKEDSSSEDESDFENAAELFAVAKSKAKAFSPGLLDINGKEIKTSLTPADMRQLEDENMRRRLNVDLLPFYDKVLKWDYKRTGEFPTDTEDCYSDVKDAFSSTSEYQNVMEPLLLLECWQGLCSARDREEQKSFSFVVGNRTVVSDFYEVYASINKGVVRETGINDSDLIVLGYFPDRTSSKPLTDKEFKKSAHTCLAKIKEIKNSKGDNMDLTFRIHRSHKFSNLLTLRSEIHALKVMQMTTVEREYTSLKGLPYYDLLKQILKAQPSAPEKISDTEVERIKSNFSLNTSQATAILSTVTTQGFSLIQGPPGTGKTKTILGIVGYFISKAKQKPQHSVTHTIITPTSTTSTEQLLERQKVLICAPSNAAVDELVLRLREGVLDYTGNIFQPEIVRIGRSDAVNESIKDLTLEEKVDRKLGGSDYDMVQDSALNQNFQEALRKRNVLQAKLNKEDGNPNSSLSSNQIAEIQMEIRDLRKLISEMGKQKDEIRESNSLKYRNREIDRRKTQARILAESDVICSTLSGSAHDVLASLGVKFDTIIIDEACQCTELSSIIPLRYGGKRCIMVGDPNQLPPTVLSGAASDMKYNQSLFVRMQKNCSPYLLDVQYRMHPSISKFPSLEFYKGKLRDGSSVQEVNKREWHNKYPFGPYKFFDIVTGKQKQNMKTMSYTNPEETKVAIELVENLLSSYESKYDFTNRIGIISPYREQMQNMRNQFRRYFGDQIRSYVDFNTIDGFQGQEKDIIIISCVRADDKSSSVGFLKDFRRMNVALTRAKCSLWILGRHKSLVNNKLWKHLISDAKERNCLELACPGFLNPNDKYAQDTIARFKGSHDYIANLDTYNPYDSFSSSTDNENVIKRSRYSPNDHPKKKLKSEGSKRQPNAIRDGDSHNTESKDKSAVKSSLTGTKKKSSIFGGSRPGPLANAGAKAHVPFITGDSSHNRTDPDRKNSIGKKR
ncbi:unnamed protein product [Kluyveromyces dobzhanskii CBS 2104]|uniref:WGS project CCBQ000000000 data, contig 00016 n=1 Tax=Kluyveromyces dobzhanskii CBS 2104 TaxID=1427455 RepID=A0A0A8L217_9SACH|nr:unnamed protein product [Kluyveromyces dobzhanskii CBS 2104]